MSRIPYFEFYHTSLHKITSPWIEKNPFHHFYAMGDCSRRPRKPFSVSHPWVKPFQSERLKSHARTRRPSRLKLACYNSMESCGTITLSIRQQSTETHYALFSKTTNGTLLLLNCIQNSILMKGHDGVILKPVLGESFI